MKRSSLVAFIIFFFLSFVLTVTFFSSLRPNEFIFIGDQFFRFNYHESFLNSFFIRKPEDLNVLNGWQFTTQFWDALYYLILYSLHISFITAEKLLFFIVLY